MMKKVILLLILQLTVLMAVDFTMSKSGTLTKEPTVPSATESVVTPPVTEPVPTVPASQSGVIPNSVDMIWADMHEKNTGWVSNMPSGYGQFDGPYNSTRTDTPLQELGYTFDNLNIWIEVEAAGDGSSCSADINQATNTRVEIGWTYGYIKRNNVWSLFTDAQQQIGSTAGYPVGVGGKSDTSRLPCNSDIYDWSITSIKKTENSGYLSVQPRGYKRWHGWAAQKTLSDPRGIQAVFGTCYVRLVLDDPSGPDDRHLANYVVHISSDARLNGAYQTDIGISRYKKVPTNGDWMPINILTGMTQQELNSNPPPLYIPK